MSTASSPAVSTSWLYRSTARFEIADRKYAASQWIPASCIGQEGLSNVEAGQVQFRHSDLRRWIHPEGHCTRMHSQWGNALHLYGSLCCCEAARGSKEIMHSHGVPLFPTPEGHEFSLSNGACCPHQTEQAFGRVLELTSHDSSALTASSNSCLSSKPGLPSL